MLSAQLEKELWGKSGTDAISKLTGFPFGSYQDFVNAIRQRDASVGIECPAARNLVHLTAPGGGAVLVLLLSWLPGLVALASVVIPFANREWLASGGAATAFIGQALASPHNPIRKLALLLSLGAGAYAVVSGRLTGGLPWVCLAFATSFFAVTLLNRMTWSWAKRTLLESEPFAAFLFKTGNLHVRDAKGEIHSMSSHA